MSEREETKPGRDLEQETVEDMHRTQCHCCAHYAPLLAEERAKRERAEERIAALEADLALVAAGPLTRLEQLEKAIEQAEKAEADARKLAEALNALAKSAEAYMKYHAEKFYPETQAPVGLWPAIKDACAVLTAHDDAHCNGGRHFTLTGTGECATCGTVLGDTVHSGECMDCHYPFSEHSSEYGPKMCPPSKSGDPPRWRVGHKVPINVYRGDEPVCQCHDAETAALIVEACNTKSGDPTAPRPEYTPNPCGCPADHIGPCVKPAEQGRCAHPDCGLALSEHDDPATFEPADQEQAPRAACRTHQIMQQGPKPGCPLCALPPCAIVGCGNREPHIHGDGGPEKAAR